MADKTLSLSEKTQRIKSIFNQVKGHMENGHPKSTACKRTGVSTDWMYANFSAEQQRLLDEIYYSFSTGQKARQVIGDTLYI